jgi:hypothetical protein
MAYRQSKRRMTEEEAIRKANAYLRKLNGVQAQPIEVHRVQRPGQPVYWWVSYGTAILFPNETAAGATVDGGEFVLRVDEAEGTVSVIE